MSVGDMRSAGNVETQESFTCNKNRPFPRNGGIPAKIRNSPSTLHKDTAEVKLTLVRALCTPGRAPVALLFDTFHSTGLDHANPGAAASLSGRTALGHGCTRTRDAA